MPSRNNAHTIFLCILILINLLLIFTSCINLAPFSHFVRIYWQILDLPGLVSMVVMRTMN